MGFKKIINGKMYNTATATPIDSYNNGLSLNDFNHFAEHLLRKKTGEFFIWGYGGANSGYSRSCGQNSWCGGEDIKPITETEAKRWLERYSDTDTYVELFGEVAE